MTTMDDPSNFLDLMPESRTHEENMDADVLDEFLDQRVYDAMLPTAILVGDSKSTNEYYDNLVFAHSFLPDQMLPQTLDRAEKLESNSQNLADDCMFLDPTSYRHDAVNQEYSNDLESLSPSQILEQSKTTPYQAFEHSHPSPFQILGQGRNHSLSTTRNSDLIPSHVDLQPHENYATQISSYECAREEFSRISFGRVNMKMCPDSLDVPDALYLDFSPEAMEKLPLNLTVGNLPQFSRVETQIKLKLSVGPSSDYGMLHIPQDMVSKYKFCLSQLQASLPEWFRKQMLYLDAYVLTSDLKASCKICLRCIKREQKRASRRKEHGNETDAVLSNESRGLDPWADENMLKKALIFNCKEIVAFPPPSGLISEKLMELLARIICYCRHHKELEGFKLLFAIKDYTGKVLGKHLSGPIMIMDRKKSASAVESKARRVKTEEQSENFDANDLPFSQPMSPHSLDELLLADSDARGLKRKKMSIDSAYSSNPMLVAGGNGYSPMSNSDTTASTHGLAGHGLSKDLTQSLNNALSELNLPAISRIIPAQGPIRGGIEVTLLGFNFRPGLRVKFGTQQALATHCWSESTIVTYLPPASEPGQVLVLFEEEPAAGPRHQQIFTYTDDTDRQLIELALQIVGLKMNGKLEDAKNIAKRIVGNDNTGLPKVSAASSAGAAGDSPNAWFDDAHRAVKRLTRLDLHPEEILVSFLSLVDLPNCPIIIPNWQLCNKQGQSLLHLATLKGYAKLVKFLINHGCKIDLHDNQGLTPLFFASVCGHRALINVFVNRKSNWNLKLSNDKCLTDYCDSNVMDIFSALKRDECASEFEQSKSSEKVSRSNSLDSLNSFGHGRHVSRMSHDATTCLRHGSESDFADVEDDSDDGEHWSHNQSEASDQRHAIEESSQEGEEFESNSFVRVSLPQNLWQKVKNAFNKEEDLPTYDDLFPLGPNDSNAKPKNVDESILNMQIQATDRHPDVSEGLDTSEDLALTFLNHPRKGVENDKMLLFFWFPALVCIIGYVFMVLVLGYQFEFYETIQAYVRQTLGQVMIGGERVKRYFDGAELDGWNLKNALTA